MSIMTSKSADTFFMSYATIYQLSLLFCNIQNRPKAFKTVWGQSRNTSPKLKLQSFDNVPELKATKRLADTDQCLEQKQTTV